MLTTYTSTNAVKLSLTACLENLYAPNAPGHVSGVNGNDAAGAAAGGAELGVEACGAAEDVGGVASGLLVVGVAGALFVGEVEFSSMIYLYRSL